MRNQTNGQKTTLLPIPKDGDLSDTNNYRGIALSAVAAKIANKLILNRIRPLIDKHLRTNQNGFRPGRSTIAHILCLRRLIEGVKSNNLKCILIFIDFRKAFDSIHRERMMTILKAYDIPDKLLTAINLMYTNTKARVLSPDGNRVVRDSGWGIARRYFGTILVCHSIGLGNEKST